jgi:transcriptional regulator with XRE-family HTH domain
MVIGKRLRALREEKNLSQGDIAKRTGLLRPYLSRVENNHTVPGVETLEKIARALEVPLYRIFYDSDEPPQVFYLPKRNHEKRTSSVDSSDDYQILNRFRHLLSQIDERQRTLLLSIAQKMALLTNGPRKVD